MDEYRRLTKTTFTDGKETVVCAFAGSPHCDSQCAFCPVMDAILKQLCAFEEAFLETHTTKGR